MPELLALPTDRPRPALRSLRGGAWCEFGIDADGHRGLMSLARQRHATVFMMVHAALAVLLAGLADTTTSRSARRSRAAGEAALDDLVGMFVNTLVLRTRVDGGSTFAELLDRRSRELDLAAFAHAEVPFERLVDELAPARSTGAPPLFQVVLAFQNNARRDLELPGLTVEPTSTRRAGSRSSICS